MYVPHYTKSHILLITGMTASRVNNCLATTSHTCYRPSNDVLWYTIPLLDQRLSKLGDGILAIGSVVQTPPQLNPCVFHGIEVWGARWPIHGLDSSLLKAISHDDCPMWTSAVIHQCEIGPISTEKAQYMG